MTITATCRKARLKRRIKINITWKTVQNIAKIVQKVEYLLLLQKKRK